MQVFLRVALAIICTFAIGCFSPAFSTENNFSGDIQPHPELLPSEVVGIQMEALNHQGSTDNGIAITFRFASPRNRASTGPLERFTRLFSHPAYEPMLSYRSLQVGEGEIRGTEARVPVRIETADGREIVYLFALSLQSQEPYLNCWMTDSVTPVHMKEKEKPEVL